MTARRTMTITTGSRINGRNRSRVESDSRIGGRRAEKILPECVVAQTRRALPNAPVQGRPCNLLLGAAPLAARILLPDGMEERLHGSGRLQVMDPLAGCLLGD